MKIYIYALIDPRDNTVKYIGATNNAESRLKGHVSNGKYAIYELRRGKKVDIRTSWLFELNKLNLKPILEILETCEDVEVEEKERHYFELYNKINPLLCLHPDRKPYGSVLKRALSTNDVRENNPPVFKK